MAREVGWKKVKNADADEKADSSFGGKKGEALSGRWEVS
jgi:hypothetical protein